MNQMFVLYM